CAKLPPPSGLPAFQSLQRAEHRPLTLTPRGYLHVLSDLPPLAQSTRPLLIPSATCDKNTDLHSRLSGAQFSHIRFTYLSEKSPSVVGKCFTTKGCRGINRRCYE